LQNGLCIGKWAVVGRNLMGCVDLGRYINLAT
jgi:hypothetical protein